MVPLILSKYPGHNGMKMAMSPPNPQRQSTHEKDIRQMEGCTKNHTNSFRPSESPNIRSLSQPPGRITCGLDAEVEEGHWLRSQEI